MLFLLRLLLLKSPTEPDLPIIETAGQMLTLVVEIILLRDQLTNSGTGLIWKVYNSSDTLSVNPQLASNRLTYVLTRLRTTVSPLRG